jgi:hypothetical protein
MSHDVLDDIMQAAAVVRAEKQWCINFAGILRHLSQQCLGAKACMQEESSSELLPDHQSNCSPCVIVLLCYFCRCTAAHGPTLTLLLKSTGLTAWTWGQQQQEQEGSPARQQCNVPRYFAEAVGSCCGLIMHVCTQQHLAHCCEFHPSYWCQCRLCHMMCSSCSDAAAESS